MRERRHYKQGNAKRGEETEERRRARQERQKAKHENVDSGVCIINAHLISGARVAPPLPQNNVGHVPTSVECQRLHNKSPLASARPCTASEVHTNIVLGEGGRAGVKKKMGVFYADTGTRYEAQKNLGVATAVDEGTPAVAATSYEDKRCHTT